MLVADVTWRQKNGTSYESGLTVWPEGSGSPAFLRMSKGKELEWVFRGPRLCVGSHDNAGRMIRCPEDSVILRSGTRCGPCAAMDIADPCIRCDGRSCRAPEGRRIQCESTDYVVYLVVFNDSTLKVGVSTKKRVLTRWVEQGADFGGVLQDIEGGRKARLAEHRLARRKGIFKQVHSSRKIRSLPLSLELEQAQALADEFLSSLDDPFIGIETELESLGKHYMLPPLERPPSPWKKRSEPVDKRPLTGEVVGMKGPILITSIGSALTATDMKQVVGYSIDRDSDITVITQTGLADFF